MILKLCKTCISFACKGWHDSDADLAGLNRISMDSLASLRVKDDQGTRPNSPASVEGGQASHAPPMNEPEQVAGGTMGILQQLVQALQRVGQPVAIAPKRSAIERTARYRPVDFMGKKEDEPSMAEYWLERTERMLVKMHCTAEEKLECATSLLQDEAYQWWVPLSEPHHQRELHENSSWMSSRSTMWVAFI